MIKLAIIIVHNKTDVENVKQINFIMPFIVKQIEHHLESTNPYYGIVTPAFDTYYYTIKGLIIEHEVKFYQIFPYGVKLPANKDDIDSYKVYYGKGDEDKVGTHPRFFNWGLKRGTDYGADIVIYLEDYTKLTISDLQTQITKINTELITSTFGKIATKKLIEKVGQLTESITFNEAITDIKNRITAKGLTYG